MNFRKISVIFFVVVLFSWIVLSHFLRNVWLKPWVPETHGILILLGLIFMLTSFIAALIGWMKKRGSQFFVGTVVWSVGILGFLALLNWSAIEFNYPGKKFDLTRDSFHSLSEQSKSVLSQLNERIEVELWSTNVKQMSAHLNVERFLDNYEIHSQSKVKVTVKNPMNDPQGANERNLKNRDHVIVIRSESGRESRIDVLADAKAEEQLTNAIIKASKGSKKKVCVITGHKEPSLSNTRPDGLSTLKESLENSSYEVSELLLASHDSVPSDCELVASIGPTVSPLEKEIKILKEYFHKGGSFLALYGVGVPQEWIDLLKEFEVGLNRDVVIDPRVQQPAFSVLTKNFGSVEIVEQFDAPIFMTLASSVKSPTKPANSRLNIKTILSSEDLAIAKKGDLNSIDPRITRQDARGPFTLGVLVERKAAAKADPKSPENKKDANKAKQSLLWKNKIQNLLFPTAFAQKSDAKDKQKEEGAANVESSGAASLVLIGNHLFAVNGLIEQMGNKDLLLNTMSYLLKDNSLIGIRPKNIREAKLSLTRENLFQVRGIILLGGVMFMLLGIWAVYRRKSVA